MGKSRARKRPEVAVDLGPEIPLAVSCPKCHAVIGEMCRQRGGPMMDVHEERVNAARARKPTEQREHRGVIVYGVRRVWTLDRLHTRHVISDSQHKAGVRLAALYEAQFKSPEQNAVVVDRSPDYGAGVVMRIQAVWDFQSLWGEIPRDCREVVMHVACRDLPVRQGLARNGKEADAQHERLRRGLDPVVKILGV